MLQLFCKSGKDLDQKLEELGGQRLLPIGIGDDQDPDGYVSKSIRTMRQ